MTQDNHDLNEVDSKIVETLDTICKLDSSYFAILRLQLIKAIGAGVDVVGIALTNSVRGAILSSRGTTVSRRWRWGRV